MTTHTTHTQGKLTIEDVVSVRVDCRTVDHVVIRDEDWKWLALVNVGEYDEGHANARHIVHCVNTYPALVEALEHALDSLQNSVHANEGGVAREINLDTVRKALALARKED